LRGKVNHRAQAAVEAVFATRRRLIDSDPGFRTKNSSDGENLAFRGALKGQDVGVLAFHFGEFFFSRWLVAGEKAACQKRHAESQNYENNGLHNHSSV
jgi:heme-degrading monooxygenase HmoA